MDIDTSTRNISRVRLSSKSQKKTMIFAVLFVMAGMSSVEVES